MLAMPAIAQAQQMVCEPCVRGDDTLRQLGDDGELVRSHAAQLAAVRVAPGGRIDDVQVTALHEMLGVRYDALEAALAQRSPAELADVAAAVCNAPSDQCQITLAATLECIAGRCQVRHQIVEDRREPGCDPYVKRVDSPAYGLGLEWGEGRHADRAPVDGRAWSIGFEGRARLGHRLGVVGRIDRSTGRDAAEDRNGDGHDDVATGPVSRVSLLAGPTMLFAVRHADATRFAQLDLLGGYLWTLSQPGENGPAAGIDVSYSLEVARIGIRVIQGFGDARSARAVLAHVGFVTGAGPSFSYGAGCGSDHIDASRLALALDLPLFGFGLSSALDYSVPGFGVEAAYHLAHQFDALAHADLLVFPNGDRERTMYHSVLVGSRLDLLGRRDGGSMRSGVFTTLMAGYAFAATTEPTTAGSGPIAEASIGWGGEGDDGMLYLRLHGRFGISGQSSDLRAIFLSAGIELRMDRRQWRDRS